MAFSLVSGQSASAFASSGTTISVTLASAPTAGNLVCIGLVLWDGSTGISLTGVQDNNGNNYIPTPNSPAAAQEANVGGVWLAYLVAPKNASATIKATFSPSCSEINMWAEEFTCPGAVPAFDKDVTGSGSSGTAINTPSLTPTYSNELLYCAIAPFNTITSVNSPWTQGIIIGGSGAANGWILSTSSNTAVNATQNVSGAWDSMIMAFQALPFSPPPEWESPPQQAQSPYGAGQAVGFPYDDDTQLNSVTGWKSSIGGPIPIPQTFEMDCDTTTRNFDLNTAFMREPEGELPNPRLLIFSEPAKPPQWTDDAEHQRNLDLNCSTFMDGEPPNPLPYIFNSPSMPFEWDRADISRNIDQFLAQQQLLDQEATPLQNFAPAMDWTADPDWQHWLDLSSAPDDVQYEEYYHPAPFFPLFGWDDAGWERSLDSRVVEDEDERELAWPIPAAQVFNAQIDWTADYEWQQSRDTRVVVDDDPLPTPRNFFPFADWTADHDWAQCRDTRVVEDEDEREIEWPLLIPPPVLLGYDQDGSESRSLDDPFCHSERSEESALPVRPFFPVADWTDPADPQRWFGGWVVEDEDAPASQPFYHFCDWAIDELCQRWFDTRVVVDTDEETRSYQYIVLQVIALALQQMTVAPLMGLMQAVNVQLLGMQEMENEF